MDTLLGWLMWRVWQVGAQLEDIREEFRRSQLTPAERAAEDAAEVAAVKKAHEKWVNESLIALAASFVMILALYPIFIIVCATASH